MRMPQVRFWLRVTLAGIGFGVAVTWYALLRLVPVSNAFRRQSFARMMSRLCCRALGVRVHVVGAENIGRHAPCIYASNHQSVIDGPISGGIFPASALLMGSRVGDWPVIGALFRSSGCITVDRDVPLRAGAAWAEAERAIRERGNSIWMFAEGTRGKVRGDLGPFKRGAFRLGVVTGRPIVPVVISPLLPETDLRGRRLDPHNVVIEILDPVYANGSTPQDERALREEVRTLMRVKLMTFMERAVR